MEGPLAASAFECELVKAFLSFIESFDLSPISQLIRHLGVHTVHQQQLRMNGVGGGGGGYQDPPDPGLKGISGMWLGPNGSRGLQAEQFNT